MDTTLTLNARLLSIPNQRQVISEPLSFKFLPAYSVPQSGITLTLATRREDISVEGIPAVIDNLQVYLNGQQFVISALWLALAVL